LKCTECNEGSTNSGKRFELRACPLGTGSSDQISDTLAKQLDDATQLSGWFNIHRSWNDATTGFTRTFGKSLHPTIRVQLIAGRSMAKCDLAMKQPSSMGWPMRQALDFREVFLLPTVSSAITQAINQLNTSRGSDTRFFSFVDTSSARKYAGTNEPHGWVGLRFQLQPGGQPNCIVLHINLRDPSNPLEQEAVGNPGRESMLFSIN
jgi:hypothetical protein